MKEFEAAPYMDRVMKSFEKLFQSSYLSIEEKRELEKTVMKIYKD